jgi:glutamate 5-kinase
MFFMKWDRANLKKAGLIVVKVGTSTLTHGNGQIHKDRIDMIVRQLVALHDEGRHVILVTSGAIGAGVGRLGLQTKPNTIPQKQACASVGQSLLMQIYEEQFDKYGKIVGQVLLTREDITDRSRYLNSRNTLFSLFDYGVIPIINENDTVAVDEIKVGDNDTLAALVASLSGADLLIILSDIDGVYTKDPRHNENAELLEVISGHDCDGLLEPGSAGSSFGTGGMKTKLMAAKIATSAGIAMVIAHGGQEGVIQKIVNGEKAGTLFIPAKHKMAGRKRWIAFNVEPMGKVVVDQGAVHALTVQGKSLLPSGIVDVEGDFQSGDCVMIIDECGKEFAKGLTNYSSKELLKIIGAQTVDIEGILGYKYYDEVIHRDNLVCL